MREELKKEEGRKSFLEVKKLCPDIKPPGGAAE